MGSVDCFFGQGDTHNICEDYATCGIFDEQYPYTIVCDGCSTSPNSDFDSRILATAIKNNLDNLLLDDNADPMDFAAMVAGESATIKRAFRFDDECCYSTALLAYLKNDVLTAHMWGDGFIVLKHSKGYNVYHMDYPSEAPIYLAYGLDMNAFNNTYMSKFGNTFKLNVYNLDNDFNINSTGSNINQKNNPFDPTTIHSEWTKGADLIAIFSDGLKSFRTTTITDSSKATTPIEIKDILKNVLSFKGTKGQFVKRRCKKFSKEIELSGWSNYDDFSMGAIKK